MRHIIEVQIDVTNDHKDARQELLRDVYGTLMGSFGGKIDARLISIERSIFTEEAEAKRTNTRS